MKKGAGIRLLEERLLVRVSGDDRLSFMHGMCTADVKTLGPGQLAFALFLTEHAHVIADCFIYGVEQALWLEVAQRQWGVLRQHLERFLVADDVELEELNALSLLDIEGPRSVDVVAGLAGDTVHQLAPWRHFEHDDLCIANLPRLGMPAFTLIAETSVLTARAEQIKQMNPELFELQAATVDTVRIENGLALIGTDTNARTLALEARLEPAISMSKGCYVGQETIERATSHGSLKRRLYGIRIIGDQIPPAGVPIQLAGKEIGRLSSIASAPAGIIGLAILHHSAWAAGTRVAIVGEHGIIDGLVCDLPFADAPAVCNQESSLVARARVPR